MKVLQVSKFYWPVMGGIETVTWELVEGLRREGCDVDVLCAHKRPVTSRERFPAGYEVVRAASYGMVLATSMSPALVQQMSRMAHHSDIVHVHMPDPMAAAAVFATRPSSRVVVHWHSDVVRQRLAMRLYEPLQRWLLKRADAIICTSEPYAEASEPLRPWRNKVAVIPIGISDSTPASCSHKADEIKRRFHSRRIVFALGRMTYYKGFDVLIDAAAELPDDCVVLIGGDGAMFDYYSSRIALRGLKHKVRMLGHVSFQDLPSYFRACDVFCMPSTVRAEAYGVAMVEAMVMGKPIVASDIAGSGVPWVNSGSGLNIRVGNSRALTDALRQLLDDPELRASLGNAARERYLKEFNAELMTRRTIDLYRRLLSEAGP